MIELVSNDDEWNSFVRHNDSSIFHTIEWRDTIRNTFGYTPYYLVSKDDGSITGCFPMFCVKGFLFKRYFISLPFAISGDPIYKNTKVLRELFNRAKEISKDSKYLEIRMRQKLPDGISKDCGFNENMETKMSVLELTNSDAVWDKIDNKTKSSIKKSEKKGLKFREGNENDIGAYYNLKMKLATKKYGTNTEPLRFYRNLWNQMYSKNMIKMFVAEFENKIVGVIILLLYKNEVLYFSGATDEKYQYLKPYDLLIWEGIKYSCKNKYKYFNFGVSNNKKLLNFNESWGAKSIFIPVYSMPFPSKSISSKAVKHLNQ